MYPHQYPKTPGLGRDTGKSLSEALIYSSTTDCSLFMKIVSSEYLQNMLCTQIVVFVLFWHSEQFWYTTCSADVASFWKRFTCINCIQSIKSVFTVYMGFISLVLTQPFVYIFMFNSVSPIQLGHYHHLGVWSWPNQFWQCCSQIIIQIGANNYTVVRSRYSKRRCLAILSGPFHK